MFDQRLEDADVVSRFCRYQLVTKRNLPIRSSEMGLLIFVSKQKYPMTPLDISEFFHIAKPTVSEMITHLTSTGYLIKAPSLVDRRSYSVEITPKGHELVETALTDYLKSMEFLKSGLQEQEYNELISLLRKANMLLEKGVAK